MFPPILKGSLKVIKDFGGSGWGGGNFWLISGENDLCLDFGSASRLSEEDERLFSSLLSWLRAPDETSAN